MADENLTHVFRVLPGADLRLSIQDFVNENMIEAGWIACCIGSLRTYSIRFANQAKATKGDGHFEILSCMGTVSVNGSHLHISIADERGKTIGGHLTEGCIIYTTAEIVITQNINYIFKRVKDESTDWNELQVDKK